MVLAMISRPIVSVPKRCSREGGCKALPVSVRLASASLKNSMPPKAYSIINSETTEPNIAILCRRNRRQVSCPSESGGVSNSSRLRLGIPCLGCCSEDSVTFFMLFIPDAGIKPGIGYISNDLENDHGYRDHHQNAHHHGSI